MGLGYVKEARRWKTLLMAAVSISVSKSMDIPAKLWCLFFGGLIAEMY